MEKRIPGKLLQSSSTNSTHVRNQLWLGDATPLQLAFHWKSYQNFPMGTFPLEHERMYIIIIQINMNFNFYIYYK